MPLFCKPQNVFVWGRNKAIIDEEFIYPVNRF